MLMPERYKQNCQAAYHSLQKAQGPRQESGSHFDSQTPEYWQNDTQLYFVRFSVFIESKEIFQQFNF